MIRLDIDYLPFIIIIVAVLQFCICLAAKKKYKVCWASSVIFFVLAGYGFIADRLLLPYPNLFMPDFMLSNALAGCFAFGAAFGGSVLGGALNLVVRKVYWRRKNET